VPPPAHASQKSPDLEMSHVPVVVRGAGHFRGEGHSSALLIVVMQMLPILNRPSFSYGRSRELRG